MTEFLTTGIYWDLQRKLQKTHLSIWVVDKLINNQIIEWQVSYSGLKPWCLVFNSGQDCK